MNTNEVIYYEVFKSVRKSIENHLQCIDNENYSINKRSDKNYGFMVLKPMINKTYIAIKFLSNEFRMSCCREISLEKVNIPILLEAVNNL
jgi:hypothetical protein